MICWTLKCQDIGIDRLVTVLCDEHWELDQFNTRGTEEEVHTNQVTEALPAPLPPPVANARRLSPGISRCLLSRGYHVYREEHCFYSEGEAVAYKADLDAGIVQNYGRRWFRRWRNS